MSAFFILLTVVNNMENNFLKNIFLGFVIGVSAITPGLSGGVIAASLGLYEDFIKAVTDIRKDFFKKFFFLLPFVIGGGAGIVLFGKLLKSFLVHSGVEIIYIFSGLVLGTVPSLVREANKKGYKKIYPLISAVFFVLIISSGNIFENIGKEIKNIPFLSSLFIGGILSFGTVIPGISSSFILMKAGLYENYISAVSSLNINEIAIISVSFVIVSMVILKIVKIVFSKYHGSAYYAIIGLLAGSLVFNFPGVRELHKAAVDFSLMYLSLIMSYFVMSLRPQA